MKKKNLKLWKDEAGAETAEWIVIVGLLLAVAIIINLFLFQGVLSQGVSTIGSRVTSAATSP